MVHTIALYLNIYMHMCCEFIEQTEHKGGI
uniref:Uncharacterized protein n=1 Tax=Arundo donax TaxID=35708 RepID=A0A0A9SDW8_ARUDO